VPETITIQELGNRMAERGADVIKSLMRMGVMATINQTIDADTALAPPVPRGGQREEQRDAEEPEQVRRGGVALLVGDVHPEVAEVAGALTPVPGGVGPLTITMLMVNTLRAAQRRVG